MVPLNIWILPLLLFLISSPKMGRGDETVPPPTTPPPTIAPEAPTIPPETVPPPSSLSSSPSSLNVPLPLLSPPSLNPQKAIAQARMDVSSLPSGSQMAWQSDKQENAGFAHYDTSQQEHGVFSSPPQTEAPWAKWPPVQPILPPIMPLPVRPRLPTAITQGWSFLFCDCMDSLITNPRPKSGVKNAIIWLTHKADFPYVGGIFALIIKYPIRFALTSYKFVECMGTCYLWRLFKLHLWIAAWMPYNDPVKFYSYIVKDMVNLINRAIEQGVSLCFSGPLYNEYDEHDYDYPLEYGDGGDYGYGGDQYYFEGNGGDSMDYGMMSQQSAIGNDNIQTQFMGNGLDSTQDIGN